MLNRYNKFNLRLGVSLIALGISFGLFAVSGCERKQRVVDVQTPVGDVKVDKKVNSGDVEVKVDTK